jgi:RNA polymerase sigma factor (sigma-70 family)
MPTLRHRGSKMGNWKHLPAVPVHLRVILYGGGDAMNHKPSPHRKWLHRLPQDLQQALREMPKPLQAAVHTAVAACKPQNAPRLYANNWLEEIYHEAIAAAWEAHQSYDPNKGCSLYGWGLQLIRQRLKAFCDRVWAAAKHESDYPCDEETGEEVEFPDPRATDEIEESLLVCAVRAALHELGGLDEQIGVWHLFEELSEREIAKRFGRSQQAVSKRLKGILAHVRRYMGVESAEGKGKKGRKKGQTG